MGAPPKGDSQEYQLEECGDVQVYFNRKLLKNEQNRNITVGLKKILWWRKLTADGAVNVMVE